MKYRVNMKDHPGVLWASFFSGLGLVHDIDAGFPLGWPIGLCFMSIWWIPVLLTGIEKKGAPDA